MHVWENPCIPIALFVANILLPREKLNTYKQHSSAVAAKCPFGKKTKVTWQSVRSTVVFMTMVAQNIKLLWDAIHPITNIHIFLKESKCSLLPTTTWQDFKELDEQQFDLIIHCPGFPL
jgi:hypothetical protein